MKNIDTAIKQAVESRQAESIMMQMRQVKGSRWGWENGGCFDMALAIISVFGGDLHCIAYKKSEKEYEPSHYFVKIKSKFYDASGVVSKDDITDKFGSMGETKIGKVEGWKALKHDSKPRLSKENGEELIEALKEAELV